MSEIKAAFKALTRRSAGGGHPAWRVRRVLAGRVADAARAGGGVRQQMRRGARRGGWLLRPPVCAQARSPLRTASVHDPAAADPARGPGRGQAARADARLHRARSRSRSRSACPIRTARASTTRSSTRSTTTRGSTAARQFADGTDVEFAVIDHVRSSRKTKRTPRGKIKTKTKAKKKTELAVTLSFPKRNYDEGDRHRGPGRAQEAVGQG